MAEFLTPISPGEAGKIHPVTLAFVGDAVEALVVNRALALEADRKPSDYQKRSAEKVSAAGQNETLRKAEGMFTDEEADIFRRARNAKKRSRAKNATAGEYSRSTGLEAVIGYLYLVGRYDRIEELLGI